MTKKMTKKDNLAKINMLIEEHKKEIAKLEFLKKYNETAPENKQIMIYN